MVTRKGKFIQSVAFKFSEDNIKDKIDDYFFPMPPPKEIKFYFTTHSVSLSAGNKKGKVFPILGKQVSKDSHINVFETKTKGKVIISGNQFSHLISTTGYPGKGSVYYLKAKKALKFL